MTVTGYNLQVDVGHPERKRTGWRTGRLRVSRKNRNTPKLTKRVPRSLPGVLHWEVFGLPPGQAQQGPLPAADKCARQLAFQMSLAAAAGIPT